MSIDPQVFLLIKPECAPYVHQVEYILRRNSLTIADIFSIPDWVPVARELYKQRIASEPPEFRAGFEGHLWLSSFLFGRRALLLTLTSDQEQTLGLLTIAQRANQAKVEFRKNLLHTRDGRIVMTMNLKLVETLKLHDGSILGYLGVQQPNGVFKPFELASEGLWDYFYLKYIHVPTPNLTEITYEWTALVKTQAISERNHLSNRDWQMIQTLNTLAPPRF